MKRFGHSFLLRVSLPVLAILLLVAASLATVALLAANQSNRLTADRQETLLRGGLAARAARVGYEQESTAIWNEALRRSSGEPIDPKWFDDNLGVWMHDYYGHDEAYVLNRRNRPIYAMQDGSRALPQSYDSRLARSAAPLLANLRAELARRGPRGAVPPQRLPGRQAFLMVGGHPAIVSIKPIAGDGAVIPAGEISPLHISVRRLDGTFARDLGREFQLQDAVFLRSLPRESALRAIAVPDPEGRTLGYIAWKPFEPGALMLRRIAPFAASAFLFLAVMVLWLLRGTRRTMGALEASRAQAKHLALHDGLTGLANRTLADRLLGQALIEDEAAGRSLALLHLDLDRFQQINDALGLAGGDELISAVARRLQALTREGDCVARVGGNEFLIFQQDAGSPAAAEILCLRIMEELAQPFRLAGGAVAVAASIGVALSPLHAASRGELARMADIARRAAKAAGGGRFVIFQPSMDEGSASRFEVGEDLRRALSCGDEFELAYQPLFDARSRRICGAEALVRWRHPSRGVLPPSEFIPVAEANGMIAAISDRVLEQACIDAARLGLPMIAVNISASEVAEPRFAARCLEIVRRTPLAARRLEIEITETALIENEEACRRSLAVLRSAGVKIALDDFGTGYSSLSHLRKFRIDRIKIDGSFVSGIGARRGGGAMVKAMVDLAKASDLKVTAEGVEREEQAGYLRDIGCQLLQGYHLSEPVDAAALDRLLRAGGRADALATRKP
ncbi:bifunctional diguanylate cyclase/phosphodiesterase [Sphingopyxis sp. KK2]|uniref:putative bifunctional diguanylate cyclase/phosphodiesterase n=1 Tax=Sphingopyxis sp. KK2 TaxID=1855727 RepID=UPI00097E6E76|nr:bifunctional diguanylate cyclase/phosphodiesterase [Sphingopyxis sp. KK2]